MNKYQVDRDQLKQQRHKQAELKQQDIERAIEIKDQTIEGKREKILETIGKGEERVKFVQSQQQKKLKEKEKETRLKEIEVKQNITKE